MAICRSCGQKVPVGPYDRYVYVRMVLDKTKQAKDGYYHTTCLAEKIERTSKLFRNILFAVLFDPTNEQAIHWSTTLPECGVCGRNVSKDEEHIYVLFHLGKPAHEIPVVYHDECFLNIPKRNSKLFNDVKEKVVFT